jgi:hypothetical protein
MAIADVEIPLPEYIGAAGVHFFRALAGPPPTH